MIRGERKKFRAPFRERSGRPENRCFLDGCWHSLQRSASRKQMFPRRMDTPDCNYTQPIFRTASPKQGGDSKVTLFVVNVEYMVYMDS